jgi:hypothetical protein
MREKHGADENSFLQPAGLNDNSCIISYDETPATFQRVFVISPIAVYFEPVLSLGLSQRFLPFLFSILGPAAVWVPPIAMNSIRIPSNNICYFRWLHSLLPFPHPVSLQPPMPQQGYHLHFLLFLQTRNISSCFSCCPNICHTGRTILLPRGVIGLPPHPLPAGQSWKRSKMISRRLTGRAEESPVG